MWCMHAVLVQPSQCLTEGVSSTAGAPHHPEGARWQACGWVIKEIVLGWVMWVDICLISRASVILVNETMTA